VDVEREGYRPGNLDSRPADLTVALGKMEVADRKQRAGYVDRKIESASGDKVPAI
jgi:hypothetical protein